MTTDKHQTDQRFSLTDGDYWERPSSQQLKLTRALSGEQFDGVVIGAPGEVPIDARDTLPLVMLRAGTSRQVYDLDLETHGHVAVVDLAANRLFTAPAIDLTDDDTEEFGPPQTQGYSGLFHLIDLRERLELDWVPGKYLVTVVLRDRLSNRVHVNLVRSSGSFQDDEVEVYIEARRKAQPASTVWPAPGMPYPRYEPEPESPAVPQRPGVALDVARVLTVEDGASCVLRAAFRLPVRPADTLREGQLARDGRSATAVVPVWLMIVGADDGGAGVVPLRVPSYEPLEQTDDGQAAIGHFAVDLLQIPGMPKRAQTYFLYAFSGPVASGPATTAFITPEMIR